MTVFVGIDPGAKGGAFLIDEKDQILGVHTVDGNAASVEAHRLEDLSDRLTALAEEGTDVYIILEEVGAAPKQNSGSTARLCKSMGLYWGMLVTLGAFSPPGYLYAELCRPSRWRRGLGITSAYTKKDIHTLVRKVYGKEQSYLIKRDIADAAAMALYAKKLFLED